MARTNWKDWNDWLVENYADVPTREIAEQIGCSMGAVKQQAHKLGLAKYPDDISFFENWTAESAYIIGLWAADGYANVRPGKGVAISISQSHGDGMMETIREIVGQGSVYHIPQHGSMRWTLYSRRFYEFLNKLFGHDVRAKSRGLQWPDVPPKYERDFIRGFCDGDGHIGIDKRGRSQIRFYCGSEAFRDALLSKIANRTGIEGTTSLAINDVHLIIYSGIKAVCLANWLYRDGDMAIARKMDAAREIQVQKQDRINKDSLTPKMRQTFPTILGRYGRETTQYLLSW
ncbi:MAG TPA: LAGLIDADG family homing endonuclease [Thiobacillus sp.]|nr:LAGLIDADG family homing endonuclease [Thiobacillus sp.]